MVKINKIALLINWPREIDMFIQLIEALPQKQKEIIVNDIKSRERGRKNLYKIIVIWIFRIYFWNCKQKNINSLIKPLTSIIRNSIYYFIRPLNATKSLVTYFIQRK